MEWRIIVPVLCLIGILHVPGNAAQDNSTNATVYRFSLRFSINDTFLSDYSNSTNNATINLKNSISSQVDTLYKGKYDNFQRFNISKFSNGSIVTEGELQFSNGSKPNASDLAQVFNTGNFTFTVITNSTSTAEVTEPAATPPATTTPTTTAPEPAKVAKISLVFRLLQNFKDIYSNLSNPETVELANNITTACSQVYKRRFPQFHRMRILKFSNGSIVTDSVLEFNATNSPTPNVTDVKDTLTAAIANGTFSFAVDNTSFSATVIPEIDSSLKDYNITFKMNQIFTSDLSNMLSDGATKLAKNITNELDGLYKNFKDFNRTLVWQFRNGSVDVDALLGFNKSSYNLPSVSALAKALAEAVRSGIIKLPIDPRTIKVTDTATGVSVITNSTSTAEVTEPGATPPATTTPTTTAPEPAKVAKISLVFRLLQNFKDIYSNLSNPETVELANNITTECSQVYKRRFPQFHRMRILKFSNGSIVTESVLEFNATNSPTPNVTDVKDTLIAAIANGTFSFMVDNTSISATVIPEIDSSLKDYNITFKMNQIFTSDLSNMLSDGATKLAKNITNELDGLYKNFKDFNRTLVWQFRNGSVDVDALLGFNKSSNNLPFVSALAKALAEAVRSGIIKLPIDPQTIKVTDTATGVSANRSPVLASMLTAVWMTLASLLLSAVMH